MVPVEFIIPNHFMVQATQMSNDESIFAWSEVDPSTQTLGGQLIGGLLAASWVFFEIRARSSVVCWTKRNHLMR